jgi:hypothetical protein
MLALIPTMALVTVIIPTRNRSRLVAQAIDSVLAQRGVELEIIVVDDGSTDDTATVLEGYGMRIRVLQGSYGSIAQARNAGMADAHGEYLAFLDSDDLWIAGKLSRQVAVLEAEPDVGVVCSRYVRIDNDGKPLPRTFLPLPSVPSGSVFRTLATGRGAVLLSSVLLRRSLLAPGEGFRTDMRVAEDSELILRLAQRTYFAAIQEPLVAYRIHTGQVMQQVCVEEMIAAHEILMREHITPGTLSPALRRQSLAARCVRWAAWSVREGKQEAAKRQLLRAAALQPGILLTRRWWVVAAVIVAPTLLQWRRVALAYANPMRTVRQTPAPK